MTYNKVTDERLMQIADAAEAVLSALAGTNDDVHPESSDMIRLWDELNDDFATPEAVRNMAIELQERRKAEAPVVVAECAICGKSCTNANHPVKAVTIESPLNTSERAELHAFRRAACNHGFPPGAHTQGVIGCVKCSGRLVMMWEQPNGGDCES